MRFLKYICGWLIWHLKAGSWYLGLGFRLYFAIGLDRDFHHGEEDISRHFKCPFEREYMKYAEDH